MVAERFCEYINRSTLFSPEYVIFSQFKAPDMKENGMPSIQTKNIGALTLNSSTRGGTIVNLELSHRGNRLPLIRTTPYPFEDFYHGSWWMVPPARIGRPGSPGEFIWEGARYTVGTGKYRSDWGIHGPLCRADLKVRETETGFVYSFRGDEHPEIFPALWPFVFDAEIEYVLGPTTLACRLTLTNLSGVTAPLGAGLHTFFPHQVVTGAHASLEMNAASYYRKRRVHGSGNQFISLPEGEPQRIPQEHDYSERRRVQLGHDDSYSNVAFPVRIVWEKVGLGLKIESEQCRHFTLFTPKEHEIFKPKQNTGFFAGEPLSCLPNALVLEHDGVPSGIARVPDGGSISIVVRITVEGANFAG